MHVIVLLSGNQHMKLGVPIFTDSKDMTGTQKLKMCQVTFSTPIG